MKKLIAIGCSYTEDRYEFPVWPTHLAERLDMNCVNLGHGGSGNEQILAKILDTVLTEKNIGLVVVMWSQFQRFDFQRSDSQWVSLNPYIDKECSMGVCNLQALHDVHSATQNALRIFIFAENILKDIPHLYIQGTHPVDKTSRISAAKSLINSFYFDYIENNISKYFIGWPIFSGLGGYSWDSFLDKIDTERNELRISEEDLHPNDKAHKMITHEIYNVYDKIND